MQDPDDLMSKIRVSDEDRSTVDTLTSKHPELSGLKEDLCRLFPAHDRVLIEVLLKDNPGLRLREHHMLLYGLVVRSKGLFRATLRETLQENKPAVNALLRSHCETLATACYTDKFPAKLRTVLLGSKREGAKLQAPNILTQVGHADKKYPGLAADYDQLSELAHPSSLSHFASVQILDEQKREVQFSSEPQLSDKDAVMTVRLLHAWTGWFLETTRAIHQHFRGVTNG